MSRRSSPDALRLALRDLAESDALEVLSDARRRARARAAKLIEDELVEELLAAAGRLRAAEPATALKDEHSSEQAWWTYCVLSPRDAVNLPQLEGMQPESSVEVVHEGELAALVSPVPAAEYDDLHLREHLEDLAWVERTARRHEAVLEEALGRVTIVPLRLCTLYRDLDGVRRLLREHADPLLESLARVAGCAEWGVKVFAEQVQENAPPAEPDAERVAERHGTSYLRQRQRERDEAEKAAEQRARCAEAVHERISACARESISNPPQRPELHGRNMTMLLNGAYLVAADRAEELRDAVKSLQAEWGLLGFVIELTGPWPAYNFVSAAAGVMR